MKRLVWLALVVLFFGLEAYSQQLPLYSLYNNNRFLYNPALTGEKESMQAYLVYRRQWADFPGAPETRALTLDGAIMKKRVGLGIYVYQDFTDILERLGVQMTYAYHLDMGNGHKLSAGLGMGIQEMKIDYARADPQDEDQLLNSGNLQRSLAFEGNAGIHYGWKGLSVGFSVPQFVETEFRHLNNNTENQFTLARHYLISAAYDITVIKDFLYIEPGAFFRMTQGSQYQIDGNLQVRFKELAWVSATYRYDYAVSFGGGFKIHDRITLGYAYDLPINTLGNYSIGGTHEVLVGIKFGKKADEGIIEELKNRMNNVEQKQQLQQQEIDSIGEMTGEVMEENEDLKVEIEEKDKVIEEQDKEIERLKAELEQAIADFEDSLKLFLADGKVDMPDDVIFTGDRSDIEFIDGVPDNKYFMVVASYKSEANAWKGASQYREEGHKVGILRKKNKSWYYVYLEKPGTLQDGLQELYKLRQENKFNDAWIHIYK